MGFVDASNDPVANATAETRAKIRSIVPWLRQRPDVVGVASVLVLTALVAWDHLQHGRGLYRVDIVTQYLPWYTYLGQHLRHGDIPGWLPNTLSGAPFAGDPQSGWMYLPVMAIFTFVSGVAGFKVLIVFHLLLAGLAAYALARVLGMTVLGAVVAATAYEFGGFIERIRCCTIHAEVGAWLPVALLGVELAVRARTWFARVGWWAVAGLGLSQMIAGWIGQGGYYGLLATCGYIAYRTLISPPGVGEGGMPPGPPSPTTISLTSIGNAAKPRVVAAAMHGIAIVAIGLGLAVGALWPRFETVAETNLAGGDYSQISEDTADTGGWSVSILFDRLLSDDRLGRWYLGGAAFALALVAPFVARRRFGVPFFVVLALVAMVLTLHEGPLHRLFYVLPRFRQLHQHLPDRILTVFYLAPAMLAGATVSALDRWPSRWRASAIALLPIALVLVIDDRLGSVATADGASHLGVMSRAMASVAAIGLLLLAIAWLRPARLRVLAGVAVLLVVFWDPTGRLVLGRLGGDDHDGTWAATVSGYTEASGAGRSLQERMVEAAEPFRFFGYDPLIASLPPKDRRTYVSEYGDPEVMALLLNNQAVLLGLQDVQGYNPVLLTRYMGFGRSINRRSQSYHYVTVLPRGWSSPLLRLLNVRYVVVPNEIPAGRPDLLHLSQLNRTVYADERVRVLEVSDALPRTWIVHDVRRMKRTEILPALRNRDVDPGQSALLNTDPPAIGQPADASQDRATVVAYEPERIRISTSTGAPGFLVLSEVYHPDWHAFVDGKRVEVYETDRVLRGIAIPAGDHVVELRYDQPSLRLGLLASVATSLAVGVVLVALGLQRRRPRGEMGTR